jgi:hypothetical protein
MDSADPRLVSSQQEDSMSNPEPFRPPSARSDDVSSEDVQRVFDSVAGPNLRVRDNLIQLAVICGGGILGAIIGAVWASMTQNPPIAGILLGGFAGVVVSLLLSGAIIGLVRLILAMKQR